MCSAKSVVNAWSHKKTITMLSKKDKQTSVRIEAINPDSLSDAFEVIEDENERIFQFLKSW